MPSDQIDYRILGNDLQMVEIDLDPGETVIAEAGMLNYYQQGITFAAKMGDGSDSEKGMLGKLLGAGKRMISGESLFLTHVTNEDDSLRTVAFAAPYAGGIMPIDLASCGGTVYAQRDAFLAAARGTKVSVALNRKLGSGFFGGEGFVLQKLTGDGMAFVHAGGTLVEKELNDEAIYVDTGCLVGFTEGVDYDIELVKSLKGMLFGGEGLWMAALKGTGKVWIQSLPFARLADKILAQLPPPEVSDS